MATSHPTAGILTMGSSGPGQGLVKITPSDADNLSDVGYARALYCIQAGNVNAVGLDGKEFTVAVPAFFILPVSVTKVKAAATTVTDIYAIW